MKYQWKDTEQYAMLYKEKPTYDAAQNRHFSAVVKLIKNNNIKSILDFGCGQNNMLVKSIAMEFPDIKIFGYDPSVEDSQCSSILTNEIPDEYHVDLLISTDCLEHVPKEELPQCLKIFQNLQSKMMYHGICTRVAKQILPDGTNAHKTVESGEWWRDKLITEFPNFNIINSDIKNNYSIFILSSI